MLLRSALLSRKRIGAFYGPEIASDRVLANHCNLHVGVLGKPSPWIKRAAFPESAADSVIRRMTCIGSQLLHGFDDWGSTPFPRTVGLRV